jgi:hypothetical protein
MLPQEIVDLQEIARCVIGQYFPEFSSCYLTSQFGHVEGSIAEVHHTYPFKDNQYKGEIWLSIDDSMRQSGLKAITGAIAHEIAHRVGWEGPGHSLIPCREADQIVIERGFCAHLIEAKKNLEESRPQSTINGYSSKELEDIMAQSS